MTTITLEVPDELAARLIPMQDQLPKILSIALDLLPDEAPVAIPSGKATHPAFGEMIDFLASSPTPQQLVAYKVSPGTQARLEELLEKNSDDGLTNEESVELDVLEQINHILILLKARARSSLTAN